nr:MAG TPA: hypothetical protein [Caudoviricetes sp.]
MDLIHNHICLHNHHMYLILINIVLTYCTEYQSLI